jgi:hypothetical protein
MATLPPNNRLVIYELPTAWTRVGDFVGSNNTAVGIPMILAGDEFADEHDIDIFNGARLVDPARVGREALFPWEAKVYALEAGE